MVDRLYGRALVSGLVRASVRRVVGDGTARGGHAVLLFEGGPKSGKTAFLKALAAQYRGKLPCAMVQLENLPVDSAVVPDLLADVVFQLAERCEPYGVLRFRRLALGLAVTRVQLNLQDRDSARRALRRVLRSYRGMETVAALLKDVAQHAFTLAQVPGVPSAGVLAQVAGQVAVVLAWPVRRLGLAPALRWYGGQEKLINLNRWARSSDPEDQLRVAHKLWRAFTADIRDNFDRGRHADEWPFTCVILLDNADTVAGRAFLGALAGLPWRGDRDDLTIVAAGRTGFGDQIGDDPVHPLIHEVGRPVRTEVNGPAWMRAELRDLTPTEVRTMIGIGGLPEQVTSAVARQVHQFTRGHPAATKLVVDALLTGTRAGAGQPPELAAVLTTHRDGRTADELLALATDPADVSTVDELSEMAAARSRIDAERLMGQGVPLPELMWHPDLDAEPTWLRRLLLCRLFTQPARWVEIHDRLRKSCPPHDLTGTLYYTLARAAVGDTEQQCGVDRRGLERVTRALTDKLGDLSCADWLQLVRTVCRAPHGCGGSDPETEAVDLLGGVDTRPEPFRQVAQVVTRLWIASDALCGRDRRELHRNLAEALRALPHQFADTGELDREISRHRAEHEFCATPRTDDMGEL